MTEHALGNRSSFLMIASIAFLPSLACAGSISDIFHGMNWNPSTVNAIQEVRESSELRELFRNSEDHQLRLVQKISGPTAGAATTLTTSKFQVQYRGLDVIGSMAIHYSTPNGTSIRNRVAQFDLDVKPTLSVQDAVSVAHSYAGSFNLRSLPALKILPNHSARAAELIYWIEIQGHDKYKRKSDLLINAHSGRVIASLPREYTLASVQVYSARNSGLEVTPDISEMNSGNPKLTSCTLTHLNDQSKETISIDRCKTFYQGEAAQLTTHCQVIDGMRGFPMAINASACNPVVTNGLVSENFAAADSAISRASDNSRRVLEYYDSHFHRNSFDNQGSQLVSVIHAGDGMDNAFWSVDQKIMVYGDGDGKKMGDFTGAVDVAGHEETHGVTEATAQLMMMGESGALNEAMSDFFGKLIENKGSWLVGEGLFLDATGPQGIRDLSNPHALTDQIRDSAGNATERPYPATVRETATVDPGETCDHTNDECWVHYNSTVPSHAAYLVYKRLGQQKSELLYYTVLTQALTPRDNFQSAAQATVDTCKTLGFSAADCGAVRTVYRSVGLNPV